MPVEAQEDSLELGRREMANRKPSKNDVVIGLAASGRTPFTIGAIRWARKQGATTVAVACNPGTPLEQAADLAIVAEVGPEVLTGSTRMKAGTAEKMILNMLSTGAMTRLGYVYDNLMVSVNLRNSKLRERGTTILTQATQASADKAENALKAARGEVAVALIMLKTLVSVSQAKSALQKASGNVRKAITLAEDL
jgi:N-acetylmuramic acid 6-phosphate etherase